MILFFPINLQWKISFKKKKKVKKYLQRKNSVNKWKIKNQNAEVQSLTLSQNAWPAFCSRMSKHCLKFNWISNLIGKLHYIWGVFAMKEIFFGNRFPTFSCLAVKSIFFIKCSPEINGNDFPRDPRENIFHFSSFLAQERGLPRPYKETTTHSLEKCGT